MPHHEGRIRLTAERIEKQCTAIAHHLDRGGDAYLLSEFEKIKKHAENAIGFLTQLGYRSPD